MNDLFKINILGIDSLDEKRSKLVNLCSTLFAYSDDEIVWSKENFDELDNLVKTLEEYSLLENEILAYYNINVDDRHQQSFISICRIVKSNYDKSKDTWNPTPIIMGYLENWIFLHISSVDKVLMYIDLNEYQRYGNNEYFS